MKLLLEDIADRFQLPLETVVEAHKSGKLKALEGSNPPEFTPESVQTWLDSQERKPLPPDRN